MRKKPKCIGLAVFAVLFVGFVGLNVLAYNHARAMMTFTRRGSRTRKPEALSAGRKIKVLLTGVNVPRPHGRAVASDVGAGCTNVTIPSSHGVRLGAWHSRNGPDAPLVILFHGYATDKSYLLQEALAFGELGCSVLLVDFRGSGESSESYTTIGFREAEDVAAAVLYARGNLPHSRLVLFGQSMGAVAILRAIHSHGVRPDAVVVEAVFDTMLNTVRNRFDAMGVPSFPSAELLVFWGGRQAGFNGFAHNPTDYATRVRCPILFLHGKDDPRARLDEARRVFDAISSPKSFKEFPQTGHEPYVSRFPREWKQTIREFLSFLN